jgi:hypothetical protein
MRHSAVSVLHADLEFYDCAVEPQLSDQVIAVIDLPVGERHDDIENFSVKSRSHQSRCQTQGTHMTRLRPSESVIGSISG